MKKKLASNEDEKALKKAAGLNRVIRIASTAVIILCGMRFVAMVVVFINWTLGNLL